MASVADRRDHILDGARRAMEVRAQLSIEKTASVDPLDAASRLGIQVWFRDARAYDGVYSAGGPPIIVLASNRPLGRTAFTCAHEIGHHVFGHGATVEEVLDARTGTSISPSELQADSFAANLLMPRSAVVHALNVRGITVTNITPLQVLQVASWLGVGYGSLIDHMRHQLKLLSYDQVISLKKNEPRTTKAQVTGVHGGRHDAIVIDAHWGARAIDCRVDDYVSAPTALTSTLLAPGSAVDGHFAHQATVVGEEPIAVGASRVPLRVTRRGKTCRAIYMHEPEEDDD
jgi:Zn-dependent peptidase ImmA (M78 family)